MRKTALKSSPVTFIIKGNQLITIRYHHPQAFPVYIKQAMKPQATAMTGWGVLISLLEAVVDRAADHLERVGAIVDDTSKQVFDTSFVQRPARKGSRRRKKPKNLEELLGKVGEEGDFTSKMRESLVSIGRMVAYMQAIIDQTKLTREMKENRARIKILQRDIISLTDHSSFLSGKISFLLDASAGHDLDRAERHHQDLHRRVGGVPATHACGLGLRHELRPDAGTGLGFWLSVGHPADGAVGHSSVHLFQAEGLAVMVSPTAGASDQPEFPKWLK